MRRRLKGGGADSFAGLGGFGPSIKLVPRAPLGLNPALHGSSPRDMHVGETFEVLHCKFHAPNFKVCYYSCMECTIAVLDL